MGRNQNVDQHIILKMWGYWTAAEKRGCRGRGGTFNSPIFKSQRKARRVEKNAEIPARFDLEVESVERRRVCTGGLEGEMWGLQKARTRKKIKAWRGKVIQRIGKGANSLVGGAKGGGILKRGGGIVLWRAKKVCRDICLARGRPQLENVIGRGGRHQRHEKADHCDELAGILTGPKGRTVLQCHQRRWKWGKTNCIAAIRKGKTALASHT